MARGAAALPLLLLALLARNGAAQNTYDPCNWVGAQGGVTKVRLT
jgi:hypothetical protein